MAGRRCKVTDVREVLRRLRLGEPERRIARDLDLSRYTVAGYRRWAQTHELLTGELPDAAQLAALLHPPEGPSRPKNSPPSPRSGTRSWRGASRAWRGKPSPNSWSSSTVSPGATPR